MNSPFHATVVLLKCCATHQASDILRAKLKLAAWTISASPPVAPSPESPVRVEELNECGENVSPNASPLRHDIMDRAEESPMFDGQYQDDIITPDMAGAHISVTPKNCSTPCSVEKPIFNQRLREFDSVEAGAVSDREHDWIPCENRPERASALAPKIPKLCIKSSTLRSNRSVRGLESKSCVILVIS